VNGALAALAALALVAPAVRAQPAPAAPTPMAERVATIGLLEKRTTRSQFIELRPGQTATFGALTVALRACETSPPWDEPMTGAFVQVDERGRNGKARRIFSGWLFAPLAALNPFEHPRYDVWVRSCAMRFPERGPQTVTMGSSGSIRSKAKNSARRDTASESNAR